MATLIAMHGIPADAAAFARYDCVTHVPRAKTIRGLTGYEVTTGPVAALGGPSPHDLVAILTLDSPAAIHAALAAPEDRATAADLGNFTAGGVDLLIAETMSLHDETAPTRTAFAAPRGGTVSTFRAAGRVLT